MATELATAYVSLIPSAKGIGAAISKEMSAPIESAANQTSGKITSIFKKAAGLIAGAFAVHEGIELFKGIIDEGNEARKVAAQTAAVIKSTGGAAKVSAADVDRLSTSISNKIGVDDEAIASGANLLLTFTNIRNEAGKGNDIFNQSTSVITDMSAALGQDLKSSAIQLGKALNDPVQGITALRRVGVSFTDQQKEQIATLVKSGDTLGAQKIILAELNKEFGGSAASQATAGARLSVTWKNIQEQLGLKLLPVLDKVANFAADKLPIAIGVIERALVPVGMFINTLRTGFTEDEGTPIEHIALIIRNDFLPVVMQVGDFIGNNLRPSLIVLGLVIAALVGPVVGVTAVLAALVGGAIYAYTHFQTLHDIVDAVVTFFTDVVSPAVAKFASFVAEQFGHLVDWVKSIWPQISQVVREVIDAVLLIFGAFFVTAKVLWAVFGDSILSALRTVWDLVKSTVKNAIDFISGVIELALAILTGHWGKAWNALGGIVQAAWNEALAIVKAGVGLVVAVVSGLGSLVDHAAAAAFDGIRTAFKAVINWVIDAWNGLHFTLPKVDFGPVHEGGQTIGVPKIPHLASGGIVTRPTLALIGEAGAEAVMPLSAGMGSQYVINVNNPGLGVDGYLLGQGVVRAIQEYESRNGSRWRQ